MAGGSPRPILRGARYLHATILRKYAKVPRRQPLRRALWEKRYARGALRVGSPWRAEQVGNSEKPLQVCVREACPSFFGEPAVRHAQEESGSFETRRDDGYRSTGATRHGNCPLCLRAAQW